MAEISVIVPIYGVEKYLKEALDSILAQTMKDLEIILIDDGSKDSCPQIIDEYAKKDNRIIVIHKPNGGYGSAMNMGLKKATGEYIAILEPDDYIDSKMYEDLYKIAKEYDSDIVKSSFYDNLQSKTVSRIKKVRWDEEKIPQDRSFTIKECPLFLYYHPSIWSCIYKREFLVKNNISFIEAAGAGWSDNPFQVQTMCLAERINYTSKAYYYWRRVNIYESDDLKDYTIPFKRSDEFHKWLNENSIDDDEILSCLSAREMSYINIVLDKTFSSDELEKVFMEIENLSNEMNLSAVTKSKWLSKNIKNEIKILKCGARHYYKKNTIARFKNRLKIFRRQFISIRLDKREKSILLFGRNILKEKM